MYEYLNKVNFIFAIVFVLILIIFIFKYLNYRRNRNSYLNACKKWDGIVNELRRRK